MRTFAKTAMAVAAVATLTTAATAADLIVDAPIVDAPAVSDWEGFYVGVFGGLAAGELTSTDNVLPTSPFDEEYDGLLVGVAAGYNFVLSDAIVGGFQVDLAYNDAATEPDSYDIGIDWSGSATARLGVDLGGVVPYALGGISFANVSVEDMGVGADEQFHTGYVLGAGVEVALTDAISANVEYRYTNYGTQIYDLVHTTSVELADSSVRGGLNFRF